MSDYDDIDDTNANQVIPVYSDERYTNPHEIDSYQSALLTCHNDLEEQNKNQEIIRFDQDTDALYDRLPTTKSGELLKQIISAESFGDHHIAIFDQWIKTLLPSNISRPFLVYESGVKVYFEYSLTNKPTYNKGTDSFALSPKYAREQAVTYGCDVYISLVMTNTEGVRYENNPDYNIANVAIGNIPIMLKSERCVLRGKTPRQLAMFGEDPKDPGGYFIVDGTEKIIQGQEQLITDKILIMNTGGHSSVRLTANTPNGTVLMEILLDKETQSIVEMKFPKLKPLKGGEAKNLNVFRIFRLFALWEQERIMEEDEGEEQNELSQLDDVKNIYKYISRFLKDDENIRKKSLLKLSRSVVDYLVFPDDRDIITKHMEKGVDEKNKRIMVTDDEIRDIFDVNLFPQLNGFPGPDDESPTERNRRITLMKLDLVSIMTARMLEHMAGFRKLDDRDSWSNKRVEGAGRQMEGLFRQAWKKTLGLIQESIKADKKKGTPSDLKEVAHKISSSSLVTSTFRDSFITGKWGVKGQTMKENIAQPLVRDSVVATFAHINTVDVAISRTDRQQILRLIQMGQFGFISAVSTPEGKNCGLIKNLCLLAKLSLGRSDKDIIRHLIGDERLPIPLKSKVFDYQDSIRLDLKDKIIVGGKFLGWGDGEAITNDLIDRRRQGEFCYDMSVIKEDDWVYVDVSPSRLIRPLLIVNPDSQGKEFTDQIRIQNNSKEKAQALDRLKLAEDDLEEALNIYDDVARNGSVITGDRIINLGDAAILLEEAETRLENARAELDEYESNLNFLMLDVKGKRSIPKYEKFKGDMKYSSNYEMLVTGCMEYISPWEQEYIKLAMYEKDIRKRLESIDEKEQALIQSKSVLLEAEANGTAIAKEGTVINLEEAQNRVKSDQEEYDKAKRTRPYTHCEIDPLDTLDVSASLMPWPNHNQAPRNTYQVSMGKQALGNFHSNHLNRMGDGKTKTLAFPQRPMVETDMYRVIGLDDKGPGENVVQQFAAMPFTEEDAFIVKKEFLDNGGMRMYKYLTYKTIINENNQATTEVLEKPDITNSKYKDKYKYIHENTSKYSKGLPKIGAYLKEGDCVIGIMNYPRVDTKGKDIKDLGRNESVILRVGDEGVVEKVLVSSNGNRTTVTVKLRIMRVPEAGDKYAPRNAQKGTVGLVLSDVDLPFGLTGITADFTANSHSMPSRMTMSYPKEQHSSKAAAMEGVHVNGGAFHDRPMNENRRILKQYGMHEFGYEDMRSGTSGKPMDALIACAPMFFQALKHHVKDKIQARGTGPVNPMTRQAPRGRGQKGGLRWEEIQASVVSKITASHCSKWQHNQIQGTSQSDLVKLLIINL